MNKKKEIVALENGNYRIRVKDFYPDDTSGVEFTEITKELLDVLMEDIRRQKKQEMADFRYLVPFTADEIKLAEMEGKIVESCEEWYCRKLESQQLHEALECIDPQNRMRFLLHYVSDIPVERIAAYENIGESAVRKSLNRTKKKLKMILENINNDDAL